MGGSLSDSLAAVGFGVLIVVVITAVVLAVSKFTQNAVLAQLRAEHPGALIVKTQWNSDLANPFLPAGRKQSSARVTGYYVGLVVNDQGIGLARTTRRPAEFGLIFMGACPRHPDRPDTRGPDRPTDPADHRDRVRRRSRAVSDQNRASRDRQGGQGWRGRLGKYDSQPPAGPKRHILEPAAALPFLRRHALNAA